MYIEIGENGIILAKQAGMPVAKTVEKVQSANPYGYVANVTPNAYPAEKSYILNIISQVAKKYDIDERN